MVDGRNDGFLNEDCGFGAGVAQRYAAEGLVETDIPENPECMIISSSRPWNGALL